MTSKEIIEEAIKIQESNLTMFCEDNKPYCEQKINNYKQVLKDLDVLNIVRGGFIIDRGIIKFIGFNYKNWEKVKEWLEK